MPVIWDAASDAVFTRPRSVPRPRAARRTPEHRRDLAIVLGQLGQLQLGGGEPDRAAHWLEKSLGYHRALFDSDPTPEHRRDLEVAEHLMHELRRRQQG